MSSNLKEAVSGLLVSLFRGKSSETSVEKSTIFTDQAILPSELAALEKEYDAYIMVGHCSEAVEGEIGNSQFFEDDNAVWQRMNDNPHYGHD